MFLVEGDMQDNRSRIGVFDFPFHSVLLSVYPILHVFSRNLVHIPFSTTIRSLALSIGVFSFLLLGFRIILTDWGKAGVLSSLLSCLFYSFGHVANAMEEWFRRSGLGFNVCVLAWTWLLVFLLLSFLVVRIRIPEKATRMGRMSRQQTRFYGVLSACFLGFGVMSGLLSWGLHGQQVLAAVTLGLVIFRGMLAQWR